jgi:SAM-dependent methyltransferase
LFPHLYQAHYNRHVEDLPFWLKLANQAPGPALELGCGIGRVLIPLAQAGYSMTGIDLSLEMLLYLKSRLEVEGASLTRKPLLFQADLGAFHLEWLFGMVYVPCNTWSTLPENTRLTALACVRRHLHPGGIFAASLPNPAILNRLPSRAESELEEEFLHPVSGNPVQVSSAWRRTAGFFTVTWFYDHLHPDGTVERLSVQARHELLAPEEYLHEIRSAGFEGVVTYGDFNQSPYSEEADYLVFVAR